MLSTSSPDGQGPDEAAEPDTWMDMETPWAGPEPVQLWYGGSLPPPAPPPHGPPSMQQQAQGPQNTMTPHYVIHPYDPQIPSPPPPAPPPPPSASQPAPPPPLQQQQQQQQFSAVACIGCRKIKNFCDKRMPTCGRCQRLGMPCVWQARGRGRPSTRPHTAASAVPPFSSSSSSAALTASRSSSRIMHRQRMGGDGPMRGLTKVEAGRDGENEDEEEEEEEDEEAEEEDGGATMRARSTDTGRFEPAPRLLSATEKVDRLLLLSCRAIMEMRVQDIAEEGKLLAASQLFGPMFNMAQTLSGREMLRVMATPLTPPPPPQPEAGDPQQQQIRKEWVDEMLVTPHVYTASFLADFSARSVAVRCSDRMTVEVCSPDELSRQASQMCVGPAFSIAPYLTEDSLEAFSKSQMRAMFEKKKGFQEHHSVVKLIRKNGLTVRCLCTVRTSSSFEWSSCYCAMRLWPIKELADLRDRSLIRVDEGSWFELLELGAAPEGGAPSQPGELPPPDVTW